MKQLCQKGPFTTIACLSVTLISACNGPESALETKIADLESENRSLKAEIRILKESFAQSKTRELANALSPKESTISINENDKGPKTKAAAEPVVKFIDLEESPTKEMIEQLSELGVFDGMEDKFFPNKEIKRAEYIEWLFKAYNKLQPVSKQIRFAPQAEPFFSDVPASHPQYKYIQALANAGYSVGFEDGTFKPEKALTREELLGIKVGVDIGKTLPPWRSQMESVWKFSDSKDVAERFTGYVHQDFYVSGPHGSNMQRAFGSIGTFQPKKPVLRYEAAGTLWQMGQFGDTQNTNAGALLRKG